jgi:hypothetical protein
VHAVVTVAACHPQPVDEGLLPCMHASLTWGVGLQVFVALSHVNPESQGVASHPCRRKHTRCPVSDGSAKSGMFLPSSGRHQQQGLHLPWARRMW